MSTLLRTVASRGRLAPICSRIILNACPLSAKCITRSFSSCQSSASGSGSVPATGGNNEPQEAIKYTLSKIDQIVKESDVVIFMKGKPSAPQCGYSRVAASLLAKYPVQIAAVDVLENELVRHAVKQYTSWPTIPQVFIKGEFIGGSDILMQMHQNGELASLLERRGLMSASTSTTTQQ
jgi:monothiol glutaredoxin